MQQANRVGGTILTVKPKDRPRFDVDALRELAGENAFARGVIYHRDGQVGILSIESGSIGLTAPSKRSTVRMAIAACC